MNFSITLPRPFMVVAFILAGIILFNSNYLWMSISFIVVAQTLSSGTAVRQGLMQFILLLVGVALATFLSAHQSLIAWFGLLILMLLLGWQFWQPLRQSNQQFQYLISFLFACAAAFFIPIMPAIEVRLSECFIGGMLGILCNLISSNESLAAIFLRAMSNNLKAAKNNTHINCAEIILQTPHWLLDAGINPTLRGGFRFFLLAFERLIDHQALISYYFQTSSIIAQDQLIKNSLETIFKNNNILFDAIILYCDTQQLPTVRSDDEFSQDLQTLENALQPYIPDDFDLIDLSPEFPIAIALLRHVRDCREILLMMVMAIT